MADPDPLSRQEWKQVALAMRSAARPANGLRKSCRALLARCIDLLTRRARVGRETQARVNPVERFICETQRRQRAADELAPALVNLGLNMRQVDALAALATRLPSRRKRVW